MKNEKKNFLTPGYEDLELSTQILIKEALNRKIEVLVLDRTENFIRLKKGKKIEYIKQATRTSADTYISPLIMENKVLTKKVLAEQGIRVPLGNIFSNAKQAFAAFSDFYSREIVIKPNSTNYGLGITIIGNNQSVKQYRKAITHAFSHDTSVIVEEFMAGREYRFLIIDNEVIAVLHRMAAHVIGDGIHSIKELIDEKNKSPLRGAGYKTPLEKIKMGSHERSFLASQGKSFKSVPGKEELIFLRTNSNISTGGDSIDYTDEMPVAYKRIAVKAAKAVGAKICGADIIINDLAEKPGRHNYGVIELNYNPAIHIHGYPYKGKNRHAEKNILNLLGF
jgi:glutamate--cysteine ligase/glutathione synthase